MKVPYEIEYYSSAKKHKFPVMTFVQHDTEVNKITFTMYNGTDDSEPMNDIVEASLTVKRPDGNTYTFGTSECFEIVDNVVTLTLPPAAVYVADNETGGCTAMVSVYDTNYGRLSTPQFTYSVTEELISDTPVDETNEYPILTGLITDVSELKDAYQGAINVNANAEVLQARGPFDNLDARLDAIDKNILSVNKAGAIGDGLSRTIASVFPSVTLADVQALHPSATLNDEADWYAIQKLINDNANVPNVVIHFLPGTYMISKPIKLFTNSGTNISLMGDFDVNTTIRATSAFSGTLSFSYSRNPEGLVNITANAMVVIWSLNMKSRIQNIFLDAMYYADHCIYCFNNTMTYIGHCKIARAKKNGITLDRNVSMFSLDHLLITQNKEYGIYIYDDCTGSKVNFCIIESNGTNVYVRNSTNITFDTCTFQMFRRHGNVKLEGASIIYFNNCYWEGGFSTNDADGTDNPEGIDPNTFDLWCGTFVNGAQNWPCFSIIVNGGYLHGISTAPDKYGVLGYEKYGIYDQSNSMSINGVTVQSLYSGGSECYNNDHTAWYYCTNSNCAVNITALNLGNRGEYCGPNDRYAIVHVTKITGNTDDSLVRVKELRVKEQLRIIAQASQQVYSGYDGALYGDLTDKTLRYAIGGKFYSMMRVAYASAAPTTGTWTVGDFVINNNPTTKGSAWGWVCSASGTPGTWNVIGYVGRNYVTNSGTPVAIGFTPEYVGQMYIDTSQTPKKVYIATATTSASDFVILN